MLHLSIVIPGYNKELTIIRIRLKFAAAALERGKDIIGLKFARERLAMEIFTPFHPWDRIPHPFKAPFKSSNAKNLRMISGERARRALETKAFHTGSRWFGDALWQALTTSRIVRIPETELT